MSTLEKELRGCYRVMLISAVGFLYASGLFFMNRGLLEAAFAVVFGLSLAFSFKDWKKAKKAIEDDAQLTGKHNV